jgi:hypothetical protein
MVQVLAKAGIMDHESRRWNRDEEQVTRSVTRVELNSLTPREAIEWYLDHRRDGVRMATHRKHESSLGTFVDWTDEVGIADMSSWKCSPARSCGIDVVQLDYRAGLPGDSESVEGGWFKRCWGYC